MEFQFSTLTVAGLTGATPRKLGFWARTGLLRPSGRDASGSGTRRKYTFRDIVALKTIVGLRHNDLSLQRIRAAVKTLREYFVKHDPQESNSEILAGLMLFTDGKQVYICTGKDRVMEVMSKQIAWSVVAVGKLIRETQDAIRLLDQEVSHEFQQDGKTYHLAVSRDKDTGMFTSQCRELPGAIEQGDTLAEAIKNGIAAVQSVLAFMAKRHQKTGGRHAQIG